MIKIFLIEPNSCIKAALKQIISDHPEMQVLDETDKVSEIGEKIAKYKFDLIFLNFCIRDRKGVSILKQIKQVAPEIPVLILCLHSQREYAVQALKAGADGYLNNESDPDELLEAVKKVSAGEKYVCTNIRAKLSEFKEKEK